MAHWRVRVGSVTWPIAALIAGAAAATPLAGQEASAGRCAAAVSRQLQAWGATGPPRDEPGVTGDALMRHWPTATIGTWVTENRTPTALVLLQATPARLTRLEWSDGCVVRSDERPRPAAAGPRFTDHDLADLVSAGRPGVVYLWSPHMPLSVDGYAAVTTAATARGMTVHAILAPGADPAVARTALGRGGLPNSALRVADSVELWHRDVHLHTPAILVYARGRIHGDAWPGFHSDAEYGAFFDRALGERR